MTIVWLIYQKAKLTLLPWTLEDCSRQVRCRQDHSIPFWWSQWSWPFAVKQPKSKRKAQMWDIYTVGWKKIKGYNISLATGFYQSENAEQIPSLKEWRTPVREVTWWKLIGTPFHERVPLASSIILSYKMIMWGIYKAPYSMNRDSKRFTRISGELPYGANWVGYNSYFRLTSRIQQVSQVQKE